MNVLDSLFQKAVITFLFIPVHVYVENLLVEIYSKKKLKISFQPYIQFYFSIKGEFKPYAVFWNDSFFTYRVLSITIFWKKVLSKEMGTKIYLIAFLLNLVLCQTWQKVFKVINVMMSFQTCYKMKILFNNDWLFLY